MPGGSVGRDQLAMAAQSLQVGFAGSLGCQFFFSPLLTSLRKENHLEKSPSP